MMKIKYLGKRKVLNWELLTESGLGLSIKHAWLTWKAVTHSKAVTQNHRQQSGFDRSDSV